MSTDKGMDKEDVVHIYNEVLLSHKKNKMMPFAAIWMDQRLSDWVSKSEKNVSYDIAYMWNLNKRVQMNIFTKQKLSHRWRKQTDGYRGLGAVSGLTYTHYYM